jgi:hypothetical protein
MGKIIVILLCLLLKNNLYSQCVVPKFSLDISKYCQSNQECGLGALIENEGGPCTGIISSYTCTAGSYECIMGMTMGSGGCYSVYAPPMDEGVYNVTININMAICEQNINLNFSGSLRVDGTPPSITVNQPEDNVIFSTNDVVNISAAILEDFSYINHIKFILYTGSERSETNYCSSGCDEIIGDISNFNINRTIDLKNIDWGNYDYDSRIGFYIGDSDLFYHESELSKSYIIDIMPPEIYISTYPNNNFISTEHPVEGSVSDSSEISYVKLELKQTDSKNSESWWNGGGWITSKTILDIDIPVSSSSFNWSYDGIDRFKLVSGST